MLCYHYVIVSVCLITEGNYFFLLGLDGSLRSFTKKVVVYFGIWYAVF